MTVGDLVTPANVASLPVGTIVRFMSRVTGSPRSAVVLPHGMWDAGSLMPARSVLDFVRTCPVFIAYLPEVP